MTSLRPAQAEHSQAMPDIVHMSGIRFAWPGRDGFSLTIDEFTLGRGERLLLTGPSGCGKSTFLGLLTGIVTPQIGAITVLGADITRLGGAARDRFRAEHFGIIFQMFNLLPYASVLDNVLLPLSFSARRRKRAMEQRPAKAEASRLLANLGIDASMLNGIAASTLSVGQQQRVAAARALIGSPPIIIADEPTSALDRDRQSAFLDLLFADVEAAGVTLIMVSHDESLGERFTRTAALPAIARIEGRGGGQ